MSVEYCILAIVIDEKFVILGALIAVGGSVGYFVSTIRGEVRPNRISWFFWTLNSMIVFVAQLQQQVGLPALLSLSFAFMPALIFAASLFVKRAYWKLTTFDYICGTVSLVGILLWLIIDQPNVAIMCSIFADFMAGIPTIRKAISHPNSEQYMPFLASMVSAFITLLTVKIWHFEYYAFPIYIFAFCGLIVPIIILGQRRLRVNQA